MPIIDMTINMPPKNKENIQKFKGWMQILEPCRRSKINEDPYEDIDNNDYEVKEVHIVIAFFLVVAASFIQDWKKGKCTVFVLSVQHTQRQMLALVAIKGT